MPVDVLDRPEIISTPVAAPSHTKADWNQLKDPVIREGWKKGSTPSQIHDEIAQLLASLPSPEKK